MRNYARNPEKGRAAAKLYRLRHPERERLRARRRNLVYGKYGSPEVHKARYLLRMAVTHGKVVKPSKCEECGARGRIHGHHEDYSKPLSVEWLCAACHGIRHRKYKAG